jgi:hypothetical protein
MTYIIKPANHHPNLERNELGLTRRDYEGTISTLCAGCGHDSISAAVIEACYELSLSSGSDCQTVRNRLLFKITLIFFKSGSWI